MQCRRKPEKTYAVKESRPLYHMYPATEEYGGIF
jgi:hypothetical protein